MAKQAVLDIAIDKLHREIAILEAAIAKLQELRPQSKAAGTKPRSKPRAVAAVPDSTVKQQLEASLAARTGEGR